MARGKLKIKKRIIEEDPKYKRVDIAKFINKVMLQGKKRTGQGLVYDAFSIIEEKTKKEPLEVFEAALKNVSPILEVRPRRIGGAAYQIPIEVSPRRRQHLVMKWIITAARAKKGKSFSENLAEELIDASRGAGNAFKKKEDTHKMAEANKALAYLGRVR